MSDEPCIYETCMSPRSDRITEPLCGYHAERVYLAVKDLLDAATTAERVRSASSSSPIEKRSGMGERHYSSQVGVVYFAECDGLIKIGFSTRVDRRMRQLGARLLLAIPGTVKDERSYQARFGRSWQEGEYYRPTPDLLSFIKERRDTPSTCS